MNITEISSIPSVSKGEKGNTGQGNVAEEFSKVLKKAIHEVDAKEKKADNLMEKLSAGETKNLHQVMLALEEADIALQLTLQIRNKLIEAYQEVSRMQV